MMPGMPRVPMFDDAVQLLKAQSDMLADLPSTIVEVQRSLRDMDETLAGIRQTVAIAHGVSARVESVLEQIEGPDRSMRPGIERLAVALDDPVIDRLHETPRRRSCGRTETTPNAAGQRL